MSEQNPGGAQPIDMGMVRRYLEMRERETDQLQHLQEVTERLGSDTQALRTSIDALATKDSVQAVEDRHTAEMQQEVESRLAALVKLRLRIRKQTYILFGVVLLLLIAAGIYFGLAFSGYKSDRYSACETHNSQSLTAAADTRAFFGPKLAKYESEHTHPDPVIVAILSALANTRAQTAICTH